MHLIWLILQMKMSKNKEYNKHNFERFYTRVSWLVANVRDKISHINFKFRIKNYVCRKTSTFSTNVGITSDFREKKQGKGLMWPEIFFPELNVIRYELYNPYPSQHTQCFSFRCEIFVVFWADFNLLSFSFRCKTNASIS